MVVGFCGEVKKIQPEVKKEPDAPKEEVSSGWSPKEKLPPNLTEVTSSTPKRKSLMLRKERMIHLT